MRQKAQKLLALRIIKSLIYMYIYNIFGFSFLVISNLRLLQLRALEHNIFSIIIKLKTLIVKFYKYVLKIVCYVKKKRCLIAKPQVKALIIRMTLN